MINTYIKIAWRNLLKNKAFSAINILGLAIGMAGALLIALWLQNMLGMDRFHEKGDRLYIMSNRDEYQGEKSAWTFTPKILGLSMATDFPDIEAFTRYDEGNQFLTTFQDKKLIANTVFVDPGFFNMFSLPLLQGSNNIRFDNPKGLVLTESYAKALFGNEDPIGKSVKIDSVNQVTVQAILKDLPSNSSFKFDILLPFAYAKTIGYVDENWGNNSLRTYILLKKGISLSDFNTKIRTYSRDHINAANKAEGNKSAKYTGEIFAFPFQDSFLYNNGKGGNYTSGRIDIVKLFVWIGIFILLVASINFMNLSTARSERRAKEVGVRKVIGANKLGLMAQFLTESILISVIGMLVAIILVFIALPFFNELVGKQLNLSLLNFGTWLFLIGFALLTGIFAGIYPAFFLSSFQPIKTLKGKFISKTKGLNVRSVLVVIQFSLAIVLIISTVVVTKQIQYTKQRERGYNENGLLYTSLKGDMEKNYKLIRDELLASNAVISVSKNMSPVTEIYSNGWGYTSGTPTEEDKRISYNRFSTDADAVKNLGLKLVQGRDIDIYKFKTDSNSLVLNESAVKSLHLKDPINSIVEGDGTKWTVVGVVKDFIMGSPFGNNVPMIIFGPRTWFTTIHYRLNTNRNIADNLKTIESIFKKFNPDYPFEYQFIDKTYEEKFKETKAIGTLSMVFAGLTIFISCLGLLALIAYMAETRMKEIAVRKVLGASVTQVTSLLSVDFIKLVIVAILIASPIAWWAMDKWLQDYSYRIQIQWHYFVFAGLVAILISMATISYQAIKAALSNPVDSLRDE
ncbi:FtsX-like permease family protein [Sphingobacterium puteale]|uniref:FtsX-like permease family protein n=1 Tax=Sphingobacterium puteale TaxID=2420510 RepID=A0A420VTA6_9SPHI|nr:ABC transporter permease [Sphingobacterium puteale]RKO69581.1 FtsX-like permease family protein [Sphingobacterium puteale]